MPLSYIQYQGRKILHVDVVDLKDKKSVMDTFDEMAKYYTESVSPIYLLLDVTGAYSDPDVTNQLKQYGKTVFKGKSKKRAIVGMTGIKSIIVKGYSIATGTEIQPFKTVEDAKNYLAAS